VHHKRDRRSFGDPWMLLTAAALATTRIKLGPLVTPVARRRPQQLARQVSTLDNLSGGRVIVGAGLGGPIEDEYGSFGEPTDPRLLAARLDEGLGLLDRYWSGESVTHDGRPFPRSGRDPAAHTGAAPAGADLDRRILAAPAADATRGSVGRRGADVRVGNARPHSARRGGS
jgi:alkanesulfonate monooxygenase SsuD/methylene tetrahydromethanopterin reductase-like flavin-dependent oxidoreductase (luciferase family)